MIELHPEFLTKNGQKQFAVLPYEEFLKITELLEDLEDLEKDVRGGNLPNTEGFFFGDNPPDSESIRNDIDFIYQAKRSIGDGLYVFYSSWW